MSIPLSTRTTSEKVAKHGMWKFLLGELKPKGKIFTPFNIISIPIILAGVIIIVIRFWKGLGAVT